MEQITGNKKIIRVGIGVAVLNKQRHILLGRRNKATPRDASKLCADWDWSLPGGGLEWGESFEDCAKREVLEETGLAIKNPKLICTFNDLDERAHWVTIGMTANEFKGTPKTMEPDTYSEWAWFALDKLPNNIFEPSFKVIKTIINNYLSI